MIFGRIQIESLRIPENPGSIPVAFKYVIERGARWSVVVVVVVVLVVVLVLVLVAATRVVVSILISSR